MVNRVSAMPPGNSWEPVYSGPAVEYLLEGLKPGATYQTRVHCVSEAGRSEVGSRVCRGGQRIARPWTFLTFRFYLFGASRQPSDILRVQTPAVPPGPCLPPRVVGKVKARDVQLRWGESLSSSPRSLPLNLWRC